MSKTLRRPLALLLLAACPVIAGIAAHAATAVPHSAASTVVLGDSAGTPAVPTPMCAACWSGE